MILQTNNIPAKVKEQYEKWVYPDPILDMELAINSGYHELGDPLDHKEKIWTNPLEVPGSGSILCAGCGPNQASYYALKYPKWEVTGIDVSEASLDNQSFLKTKHNLDNLTLCELDLLDVNSLKTEFDIIVCTGVLHHLAIPEQGLKSLGEALTSGGVASLMVYGSAVRAGVHMLQSVFRELGLTQDQEDVNFVRQLVYSLPPQHPLNYYLRYADDLKADAGLVDTFLHPQETSYSAREVFDFTRSAGLRFINWCEPEAYDLSSVLPDEHILRSKLKTLSPEQEAQLCDRLTYRQANHRWFATTNS